MSLRTTRKTATPAYRVLSDNKYEGFTRLLGEDITQQLLDIKAVEYREKDNLLIEHRAIEWRKDRWGWYLTDCEAEVADKIFKKYYKNPNFSLDK